ncbi:TPA: hypothetical protein UM790_001816 [Stenotrophomonas maltophilia]|nr:hypothetical protein [Stenotrophomonas maltophilia]
MTIPTERQVLRKICDMYYGQYLLSKRNERLAQILVPISVEDVAKSLGTDKHLLFGYLRHLDRKYTVKSDQPHTAAARLFMPKVGEYRDAVDFPYLVALLANHEQERSKFLWSIVLSAIAIVISFAALFFK